MIFLFLHKQATCIVSPVGTFVNGTGASSVVTCPLGFYQSTPGQSVCLPCPRGSVSASIGSGQCVACTNGTYASSQGLSACTGCAATSYAPSLGSDVCSLCGPGTFNNLNINGFFNTPVFSCFPCAPGSFMPSPGALACLPCPSGTFQSSAGSTTCQVCPAGNYISSTGALTCLPCPAGTFSRTTNSSTCLSCIAGTYADAAGFSVRLVVDHSAIISIPLTFVVVDVCIFRCAPTVRLAFLPRWTGPFNARPVQSARPTPSSDKLLANLVRLDTFKTLPAESHARNARLVLPKA